MDWNTYINQAAATSGRPLITPPALFKIEFSTLASSVVP
ncbi:hypothetical protein D046_9225, partial [Vibrio parahaemolyticus V-223/04]